MHRRLSAQPAKKTAYTGRLRPAKPPAHSVRPSARKNPALAITATVFASCRIKTVLHGCLASQLRSDGRDELCNKPDRQGVPVGPRQRVREESAGVTCLSPGPHLATGRPITQAKKKTPPEEAFRNHEETYFFFAFALGRSVMLPSNTSAARPTDSCRVG